MLWRSLLCVLYMCSVHCSSSPVDPVNEETPAFDLTQCLQKTSVCTVTGAIAPVEALFPNEQRAIVMYPLSQIESKLLRPPTAKTLRYLVIGLRARGADNTPRQLEVEVQGQPTPKALLKFNLAGFHRVEIDVNFVPSPEASVRISNTIGEHEIVYVEGRWL